MGRQRGGSSFRPGLKERLYQTVDGEMREPPERIVLRRFFCMESLPGLGGREVLPAGKRPLQDGGSFPSGFVSPVGEAHRHEEDFFGVRTVARRSGKHVCEGKNGRRGLGGIFMDKSPRSEEGNVPCPFAHRESGQQGFDKHESLWKGRDGVWGREENAWGRSPLSSETFSLPSPMSKVQLP